MRIACLMMQKNEREILAPWLAYHADLFGAENIFVYDNGSTCGITKEILKRYADQGVNVDYSRKTFRDFSCKGEILSEKIQQLDQTGGYDFYFPLDCDEFVAVQADDGSINIDRESIDCFLLTIQGDQRVLMIGAALDNNPIHEDSYRLHSEQRKCFFAVNACRSLDIGFHAGRAKNSQEFLKTKIAYFHIHHKPFKAYRYFSYQKLVGRLTDLSKESLHAYWERRAPGFHLVPALLMSEEEYDQQFSREPSFYFPKFREKLASLAAPLILSNNYPDLMDVGKGAMVSACRGYVDSVEVIGGITARVVGWAVTPIGKPANVSNLRLGVGHVANFTVAAVRRPDVEKVVGGESLWSGFEILFALADVGRDAMDAKSLEILVSADDPEFASNHISLKDEKLPTLEALKVAIKSAKELKNRLARVPSLPAMPEAVLPFLFDLMSKSSCYLEYGSGGTTVKASELGLSKIISVESDVSWLDAVAHKLKGVASKSEHFLLHEDIGPTKEWGFPVSDASWHKYSNYALGAWGLCREKKLEPDLVLIDGRFRVACFLASIVFGKPGATVLFDDYVSRSYYHSVETFVPRAETVDRLAKFVIPTELPRDDVWLALMTAVADPR